MSDLGYVILRMNSRLEATTFGTKLGKPFRSESAANVICRKLQKVDHNTDNDYLVLKLYTAPDV